jgi:hypothetical protein
MEARRLPAFDDEAERLRELHDAYAWEINAAIAEDREDLIPWLADAYLDDAMRAMAEARPTACDRPGCASCARPAPPRRRHRGWLRRFFAGA